MQASLRRGADGGWGDAWASLGINTAGSVLRTSRTKLRTKNWRDSPAEVLCSLQPRRQNAAESSTDSIWAGACRTRFAIKKLDGIPKTIFDTISLIASSTNHYIERIDHCSK